MSEEKLSEVVKVSDVTVLRCMCDERCRYCDRHLGHDRTHCAGCGYPVHSLPIKASA
jgi:peptide methionine sulfoxide reductase MsrB